MLFALQFEYSEGINVGYRWFDKHTIDPLFAFGHGLSYTKFEYVGGEVDIINHHAEDPNVEVSVKIVIKNTGRFDGAEIPQLYLSFPEIADEPPQLLRGFEKLVIPRGQDSFASFKLKKTELSYYNVESHQWVVPKGKFTVYIGSSSRDIKYTQTFTLN